MQLPALHHHLPILLLLLPLLLLLSTSASASASASPSPRRQQQQQQQQQRNQRPIMAQMADKPSGSPLLADIMPLTKSISIFSGFARSVESVSRLLSSRGQNATVLAPSNAAVTKLPRKPWEDPGDYDADDNDDYRRNVPLSGVYAGVRGEDRAGRNLRRFVEAHVVGVSPWEKRQKVRTVEGVEIWWEEDAQGRMVVYPDGLVVQEVGGEAANGALWVVDGVVNYDQ